MFYLIYQNGENMNNRGILKNSRKFFNFVDRIQQILFFIYYFIEVFHLISVFIVNNENANDKIILKNFRIKIIRYTIVRL